MERRELILDRELVRALVHDLNNVLAAMNGSVGYLATKLESDEELKKRAQHLQKCVEKGVLLVKSLDQMSAVESERKK